MDEWQKNAERRCNIPVYRAYFYTKDIVRFWRKRDRERHPFCPM